MTKDPSERDLGAYRVEGVNGKVNALYEGVCRIKTRRERREKSKSVKRRNLLLGER